MFYFLGSSFQNSRSSGNPVGYRTYQEVIRGLVEAEAVGAMIASTPVVIVIITTTAKRTRIRRTTMKRAMRNSE
ncbi:Hypothetical protein FKW44_007271 [Caligus rogercresseyi]|uniref:Uncharacterized protein n=1 Tax=Caligus rogercresseyi TaxID=217165 RepID=A0A7T8QTG2_CALRO|nr:Hypothetical protein FKW44_007271 [Caligus rogercresseyi]